MLFAPEAVVPSQSVDGILSEWSLLEAALVGVSAGTALYFASLDQRPRMLPVRDRAGTHTAFQVPPVAKVRLPLPVVEGHVTDLARPKRMAWISKSQP